MDYLVIPPWKLALGIEDLEDIEEAEQESIYDIINSDTDDTDVFDTEIRNLTLKQAAILHKYYNVMQDIAGIDKHKLLLFWLKDNEVEYDIVSDDDIEDYKKDGYIVIDLEQ